MTDGLAILADKDFISNLIYSIFRKRYAELNAAASGWPEWTHTEESWREAFEYAIDDVVCKTASLALKDVEELERQREWAKREENEKTPVGKEEFRLCYGCGAEQAESGSMLCRTCGR